MAKTVTEGRRPDATAGTDAIYRSLFNSFSLDKDGRISPLEVLSRPERSGLQADDPRLAEALAAAEGQTEVVRYLLAAGADPQDRPVGRHTPVRCPRQRLRRDRSATAGARRTGCPPYPPFRQARGNSDMSGNDTAGGSVVAVLLADGWHRIVPGSFRVGPLSFGAEAGPGTPGFRFEEADAARPYQPAVLAGPLHSIIAVRQVTPVVRHIADADRARAAPSGQRPDHSARLQLRTSRLAAEG